MHFPSPQEYPLFPETPLLVLSDEGQQVVQLDFIARRGRFDRLLEGVVPFFLAETLPQGSQKTGKKEVDAQLDQYGALLTGQAFSDTIRVRLTVLQQYFHHLIPLLAELLTCPSFPEEALQVAKEAKRQSIQLAEVTPAQIARRQLALQVFGSNHPYGYSIQEKDLAGITPEAVQDYFQKYGWNTVAVILSGKVNQKIIDQTQQHLKRVPLARYELPVYPFSSHKQPLWIEKGSAAQTSIAMGSATITRTAKEYPDFYLMAMLLGGYFGSRLMQNIREEKGYTYGISCQIVPFVSSGYFCITTEVKKGVAQATCQEIIKEIKKLQDSPVGREELYDFQEFMKGKLLSSFDSTFALAHHLAQVRLHGQSLAYYETLYKALLSLTPTTLQAMARRLDIDQLSQVVVNG